MKTEKAGFVGVREAECYTTGPRHRTRMALLFGCKRLRKAGKKLVKLVIWLTFDDFHNNS